MSTQLEALRLADALESLYSKTVASQQAAVELRRLHAANIDCVNHFNALMDERNELLEALKDLEAGYERLKDVGYPVSDCQKKARAVIAKAKGEQA